LFTFSFLLRAAGRTVGSILTLDGSFDADFAKEVPFGVANIRKQILEAKFSAKI
jgi:hypothetical protein